MEVERIFGIPDHITNKVFPEQGYVDRDRVGLGELINFLTEFISSGIAKYGRISIDSNMYQENALFIHLYDEDRKCVFWAWGFGIDLHNGRFVPYFAVNGVGNRDINNEAQPIDLSFIAEVIDELESLEDENIEKQHPYENPTYEYLKEFCGNDLDWAVADGII